MYISMLTNTPTQAIRMDEKGTREIEKEEGGVYWRVWGEEREGKKCCN